MLGRVQQSDERIVQFEEKTKQLRSFKLIGSSPKRVQVWKTIYVC